ncbi:hypothetical protein NDU88_000983 [Pleurodeles waltl]|uniref:Uncharacterized protein n=1 Tax=Pleurodeles waltl TaxID=8319 RepID=A0AAV7P5C0_PLEWA|nr:hypothetical protein NDU88_000983 [Pleurodeles waltl]
MSPLERERVITKMAYDLTGDGCDPVGKWLLRLPVQTPVYEKLNALFDLSAHRELTPERKAGACVVA